MMKGQTMKGQTMKLRNMSAYVTEENITIELANGAARILECERLRNRIRSTFTMFATRNEVYSEFANAVLDEF